MRCVSAVVLGLVVGLVVGPPNTGQCHAVLLKPLQTTARPVAATPGSELVKALSPLLLTNGQGSGFSLNSLWMPLLVFGLTQQNNRHDGVKGIMPMLASLSSSSFPPSDSHNDNQHGDGDDDRDGNQPQASQPLPVFPAQLPSPALSYSFPSRAIGKDTGGVLGNPFVGRRNV